MPEQFIFDPASNLLGMLEGGQSDGAGISPSDSIDQPAKGNRLAMQGDQHFTYDLLGRRIEKRWGKGQRFKQIYRYDANSQLALVQSQGEQTRYQYDAFGRRILKASEDQQTRFYWLGDSLIKEQHTSAALGTQSTPYLFEPEQGNSESFKPVALVKSDTEHPQGEIYHIHTDHLGTLQEVSNEHGEIVWAPQYKAYGGIKKHLKGQPRGTTGRSQGNLVLADKINIEDQLDHQQADPSFTLNLRFMGQYFNQETGLHYNRHRYYDPECGQFTTQDPIGLMGGLNNYQYVPNPVSWVDPLGLECEKYGISSDQFNELQTLVETDPARAYFKLDRMIKTNQLDFSTSQNEDVFWSGGKMKIAQKWAMENGKKTLEQTKCGRVLADLKLFENTNFNNSNAAKLWNKVSNQFASKASGVLHTFSTGATRFGDYGERTWWRIEKPILENNDAVVSVMRMKKDGVPAIFGHLSK